MKTHKNLFPKDYTFQNLLIAHKKAKQGIKPSPENLHYFFHLEKELMNLSFQIKEQTYKPGSYQHFKITDPKERIISVAPFRDRIVSTNAKLFVSFIVPT